MQAAEKTDHPSSVESHGSALLVEERRRIWRVNRYRVDHSIEHIAYGKRDQEICNKSSKEHDHHDRESSSRPANPRSEGEVCPR